MKARFKVVPAVYLILEKEGRILLARRHNTGWEDGNYSLPSGHIDGNEAAKVALAREAKEEIGVKINPKNLEIVHLVHRNTGSLENERVDFFFKTSKWQGTPKNMEPAKCDHLAWFSTNKLPKNIVTSVQKAIKNYLRGSIYSEYGW